jgi:hypothetical protein
LQLTVAVFATRDEIRDWLAYQAERFDLHFALVPYWPEFEVVPLTAWCEFDQHKDAEHWREVPSDPPAPISIAAGIGRRDVSAGRAGQEPGRAMAPRW